MGKYITKKKEMNFSNVDALQPVVNVVNEAAAALNDKTEQLKKVQSQKSLLEHWEQGLAALLHLPHYMALAW